MECDYRGCTDTPLWHIEDDGAWWETNALACNRHLGKLCDPKRKSVVQRITEQNRAEIEHKRDYGVKATVAAIAPAVNAFKVVGERITELIIKLADNGKAALKLEEQFQALSKVLKEGPE